MADKIISYERNATNKLYEYEWYQSYQGTSKAFQWNLQVYLKEQNLTKKTTTVTIHWQFRTHYVKNLVWSNVSGCSATLMANNEMIYSQSIPTFQSIYVWYTLCEKDITLNNNSDGTCDDLPITTLWKNTSGFAFCGTSETKNHIISIPSMEVNVKVPVLINGEWKTAIPYILIDGNFKEVKPYIVIDGVWKEILSS